MRCHELLKLVGVAVFTCACAGGPPPDAAAGDPPPPAAAENHADLPRDTVAISAAATESLTALADQGRFAELLARLEQETPVTPVHTSLRADLERYEQHVETRRKERREAYEQSIADLDRHLAEGDLEDALVAAIEAHGLAEAPGDLLGGDKVRTLSNDADAAARRAEREERWVDAVSLFRLLDLLYEESGRYREDLTRAALHIRVLQTYAPEALTRLYKERAARREAEQAAEDEPGDDVEDQPDEPVEIEYEKWQARLRGVEIAMLRDAVRTAAEKHVDGRGYPPLVVGAFKALDTLVETDTLDDVFPGLADADAVASFKKYLREERNFVRAAGNDLTRADVDAIIDGVMQKNQVTVRLPEQVLIYEMTEGATSELDDFTSVVWPADLDTFKRSTHGAFFGVGIQIERRDGEIVVVSPLENTPAQKAGIRADDVIVTVDGKDTTGWSLRRAVLEITGPEGTDVKLGLKRKPDARVEVSVTRRKIDIESIRGWVHLPGGGWDYWIDRDAGIGYIRLSQFIPQTTDRLKEAIDELQKQGDLKGLILDLRFNPGGLLDAAIGVSDLFLDEGPIVSTVDGRGDRTGTERASGRSFDDFEMVVLVNQGAASASEIVAGALQDHNRATVIGTRTFGKGSVQELFGLDGRKATLKLTRRYYMLPAGRIIHRKPGATRWGIEPDLPVPVADALVRDAIELRNQADVLREAGAPVEDDAVAASQILEKGVDPQLETAVLVLKTRIVAEQVAIARSEAEAAATP